MPGIDSVSDTIRKLMKEGSRCRTMMLVAVDPAIAAAITKSSSRNCSSLPRTTRASPVQASSDRMMVIPRYTCSGPHWRGTAADNAIHSGMEGIDCMNSIRR